MQVSFLLLSQHLDKREHLPLQKIDTLVISLKPLNVYNFGNLVYIRNSVELCTGCKDKIINRLF